MCSILYIWLFGFKLNDGISYFNSLSGLELNIKTSFTMPLACYLYIREQNIDFADNIYHCIWKVDNDFAWGKMR